MRRRKTDRCFKCGERVVYDGSYVRHRFTRRDPHSGVVREITSDEGDDLREREAQGESLRTLGRLGYRLSCICPECAIATAEAR